MTNEFAHFVLTRFNIRWSKQSPPPDLDWLKQRFNLFDNYCFPSVKSQTNQNFKWLVFFDNSTPEIYKIKINQYSKWRNFIPCFVSNSRLYYKERIMDYIDHDPNFLITTRLDNDDAVAKNFINVIQEQFKKQNFEFINVTNGYVFHKGKLYFRQHRSNSFISLIEKRKNFKTVWCKQHGKVVSIGTVKQITTTPLWFQIYHEKNFRNRHLSKNSIRVPLKKLKDSFIFEVKRDFYEENLVLIFLENLFRHMIYIPYKLKELLEKNFLD